jgi:hypothetical protein
MEGYKYQPNEKGVYVPKIEDNDNDLGITQRAVKTLLEEV